MLDLPPELIHQVLTYLSLPRLAQVAQINKRWEKIVGVHLLQHFKITYLLKLLHREIRSPPELGHKEDIFLIHDKEEYQSLHRCQQQYGASACQVQNNRLVINEELEAPMGSLGLIWCMSFIDLSEATP